MSSAPAVTHAGTTRVSGDGEHRVNRNPHSKVDAEKTGIRRTGFVAAAARVIDALAQAEFEPLRTTLNWRA